MTDAELADVATAVEEAGRVAGNQDQDDNYESHATGVIYNLSGHIGDLLAEVRRLKRALEIPVADPPRFGNHIEENGEVIASFKSREDAELLRQTKRLQQAELPIYNFDWNKIREALIRRDEMLAALGNTTYSPEPPEADTPTEVKLS